MWGATLDGEGNSITGAKGSKAGTPRSEKEVALASISRTISALRVAVYVIKLTGPPSPTSLSCAPVSHSLPTCLLTPCFTLTSDPLTLSPHLLSLPPLPSPPCAAAEGPGLCTRCYEDQSIRRARSQRSAQRAESRPHENGGTYARSFPSILSNLPSSLPTYPLRCLIRHLIFC